MPGAPHVVTVLQPTVTKRGDHERSFNLLIISGSSEQEAGKSKTAKSEREGKLTLFARASRCALISGNGVAMVHQPEHRINSW